MQRPEDSSLLFRGDAELGCPLVRDGFSVTGQPMPGIRDRLFQRTAAEPCVGRNRRRDLPSTRIGAPQRQLSPLPYSLVEQNLVPDPYQFRIRACHRTARLQQGAEGRPGQRCRDIEDAAEPRRDGIDRESRHVAYVDWLDRATRVARSHDLAAVLDPAQPPWQPADVLIRAEDHPWAKNQSAVTEYLTGGTLAAGLEESVLSRIAARIVRPECGIGVRRAVEYRRTFR